MKIVVSQPSHGETRKPYCNGVVIMMQRGDEVMYCQSAYIPQPLVYLIASRLSAMCGSH
jgi:hypothetical protein